MRIGPIRRLILINVRKGLKLHNRESFDGSTIDQFCGSQTVQSLAKVSSEDLDISLLQIVIAETSLGMRLLL